MKLNNEEKRHTLNEYLRHISHFADREYQKRVWIRGEGPECQAFDDAVCDFFDIGDPILDESKEFGITESQYVLLMKLRDEFKKFSDAYDLPEEFIDTPEWQRIMKFAKEVLEHFNYHKNR